MIHRFKLFCEHISVCFIDLALRTTTFQRLRKNKVNAHSIAWAFLFGVRVS